MPAGSEPITGQVFNGTGQLQRRHLPLRQRERHHRGLAGALGTNAEQLFSVTDAVYKGLAISAAKDALFAANFH